MDWQNATIGQALRRSARTWPDNDFVVGMGQRMNFADFDAQVDRLARGFLSLGVGRGDHVACWLTNSPSWLLTWFACCRIGATVVSINTRYKVSEVEYILRQSDAKVLVAMPEYWNIDYLGMIGEMAPGFEAAVPGAMQIDGLPELRAVVLWRDAEHPGTISQAALMAQAHKDVGLAAAEAAVEAGDPVIIIYTSGTTGQPKGAMHCHRVLIEGQNIARAMHMEAGDKVLGHMPLYHVAGSVATTIPAMQHGCCLVTMAEWEPGEALDLIERERIAILGGIPTHFFDLLAQPGVEDRDTHCLKTAWIGGAPVTPAIARKVKTTLHFEALQAVYGMTETMGMTTLSEFDAPIEVTCENKGKPIGDYEVGVFDPESGRQVAQGEDGEIWVRGYLVMLGYYKNPEATAAAITPEGWFRTGDLGQIDPDGYLLITGRAKEMFIVGGSNAYPAEIERFLETNPDIYQAVVCGVPDARMGEVGFTFVMPVPGANLSAEDVINHCRGAIADYKVPRYVEVVDDFPRTSTNKIQRYLLQQDATARFE
ncbi:MAG: AMP-binding protein [Alphaproteobacteria bacterium]|nr:AMP-binding protein [Alphaproteobacteria bacterium]